MTQLLEEQTFGEVRKIITDLSNKRKILKNSKQNFCGSII